MARLARDIFTSVDLPGFTQCTIPAEWYRFLLPGDDPKGVDLSGILYRAQRAIGGGWTERILGGASVDGRFVR